MRNNVDSINIGEKIINFFYKFHLFKKNIYNIFYKLQQFVLTSFCFLNLSKWGRASTISFHEAPLQQQLSL